MVMALGFTLPAYAQAVESGVTFDYGTSAADEASPRINEEISVYVSEDDLSPSEVTSDNNWTSQRLRVTVSDFTDTLKKVTLVVVSDEYGTTMSKPLSQGQTATITIPSDAGTWTLYVMSNGGSGDLTLHVRD